MEYDPEIYSIALALDDLFTLSPFSPALTNTFRQKLAEFYRADTVLITEEDQATRDIIYNPANAGKTYSVLAFSYQNEPYLYYLLDNPKLRPDTVFKDVINLYKQEDNGLTPREKGEFIAKEGHRFFNLLDELLAKNLRSKRKLRFPDGTPTSEYQFPSQEKLQRFYECERKVVYATEEEALQQPQSLNDTAYACPWGDHWHLGKNPTGMEIPLEIKIGRWRTIWRREHANETV